MWVRSKNIRQVVHDKEIGLGEWKGSQTETEATGSGLTVLKLCSDPKVAGGHPRFVKHFG